MLQSWLAVTSSKFRSFFVLPEYLISPLTINNLLLFCSSECKTSRGVHQGFYSRQRHPLRSGHRQPAGVSCGPGDDPARPGGHAGPQTGDAAHAASPRHAQPSSTSVPPASSHAPAHDARRTHVPTRQVQNAHALSSPRPPFPSTSSDGTGRHERPRREGFPQREAGVWVPAALPQGEVVEVRPEGERVLNHCDRY